LGCGMFSVARMIPSPDAALGDGMGRSATNATELKYLVR
jgi:hypothetical protein